MSYKHARLFRIPMHISMCSISERTIVLYFYCSFNDESQNIEPRSFTVKHTVYHVVAIRSTIEDIYRRKTRNAVRNNSNIEYNSQDMEYVKTIVRDELLFVDTDYMKFGELATLQDLPATDAMTVVVACPWPKSQDQERLAELIREHTQILMELTESKARQEFDGGIGV